MKAVYKYQAKWEKHEKLTNYSGLFYCEKSAKKWYDKFGKGLEKQFNRKLILTKRELKKT